MLSVSQFPLISTTTFLKAQLDNHMIGFSQQSMTESAGVSILGTIGDSHVPKLKKYEAKF